MTQLKTMKLKIVCLLAALVALSPVVRAEDKKPEGGRPNREEMREKFKNMTPEERQAAMKKWREEHPDAGGPGGPGGGAGFEKYREEMKETAKQLGLNPEELQKLPPEERRTKFREAADKKIAELNAKKEKGSLTEDEQKLLTKLEDGKKRMEEFRKRQGGPGSKPGEHGKPDGRDARKPAIQDEKK